MFDTQTNFTSSTLNNRSSPSSTTAAGLTDASSTPTFTLLDDGSLAYNDGNSLFPSFPDSSMVNHGAVSKAPRLESTTTDPHPGLSLPPKPPSKGTKRGRPTATEASERDASPADVEIVVKRQRNNVAAKKYRQKKIDRIEELEAEVDEIKKERDDLRIQLAKREAETAALREMLNIATKQNERQ
ncbi:hypothetical protein V8F06_009126 [Rhypophila decipiens]